MPFLKFLNLSENDFSEVDVNQIKPYELHNVRSLVLNNTLIPWPAVDLLLGMYYSISLFDELLNELIYLFICIF